MNGCRLKSIRFDFLLLINRTHSHIKLIIAQLMFHGTAFKWIFTFNESTFTVESLIIRTLGNFIQENHINCMRHCGCGHSIERKQNILALKHKTNNHIYLVDGIDFAKINVRLNICHINKN